MADKNRVNNHNSRKGTSGKAINVQHHDRDFDINSVYAEHIDSSRVPLNVYKRYQTVEKECATFDEYEQAFYEENFSECLQARNEKAIKGRQPKRVQTMEQYRHNLKACPEESIFTLSNAKNPVSADVFQSVFDDFIAWHIETFPNCKVLDSAIHLDEANPHAHWRRVWTAHEGEMLIIGQNKALDEMGIARPDTDRSTSRTNNAKVTYTKMCREKQLVLARKYGIEVEEIAQEPTKSGKTLLEYQVACLTEELSKKEKIIEELQPYKDIWLESQKEYPQKRRFEPQAAYNARRRIFETGIGVKAQKVENERTAQNNANESIRLAEQRERDREYTEQEDKRLRREREEFEDYKRMEQSKLDERERLVRSKEDNINVCIDMKAREMNAELIEETRKLKAENIDLKQTTRLDFDEIRSLTQENNELKDRIDELENPHQSYGYGLKM